MNEVLPPFPQDNKIELMRDTAIKEALKRWHEEENPGDIDILLKIGIEQLVERGEAEALGFQFFNQGMIIAHDDFIAIQNEQNTLSPPLHEPWSFEHFLNASTEYQRLAEHYHSWHASVSRIAIAKSHLNAADNAEVETVYHIWHQDYERTGPKLYCIPYYEDNPSLWHELGVPKDMGLAANSHSPNSVIWSNGLVYASQKYRKYGKGPRHDFVVYAGIEMGSVHETMRQTAIHEYGGHGCISELIYPIINAPFQCPVSEGIGQAISPNMHSLNPTDITFSEFFDWINIHPRYYEAANSAAYKFYRSVYDLVKNRIQMSADNPEAGSADYHTKAWEEIFSGAIIAVKEIQQLAIDSNPIAAAEEKIRIFHQKLLKHLQLDKSEIELGYNRLNSVNQGN